MSNSTTEVRLLSVPLETDHIHTIFFQDLTSQANYFKGVTKYDSNGTLMHWTDFSYQREDDIMRVPISFEDAQFCNYVMYKNPGSNYWIYAFITDRKFVSSDRTDITLKTDSIQTYMTRFNFNPCLVEREHVSDDTIGLHTIPEDINVGPLVCDYTRNLGALYDASGRYWAVVACNYDPDDEKRYAGIASYGDYPQGCIWFAFEINPSAFDDGGINALSTWIYDVTKDGHAEDIQSIFVIPFAMIDYSKVGDNHKLTAAAVSSFYEIETFEKGTVFYRFSDYDAPRNNKLYCYPYNFLRLSNNSGAYNDYKIEEFYDVDVDDMPADTVRFATYATPCIGVSGKVVPINYQKTYENDDESVPLGKYPILSWSSDAYTNWLTQNALNTVVGFATSVASGAVSGAVGGPYGAAIGAVVGGVGYSASVIGGMSQAGFSPNTAQGNANAGDVNFNHNRNNMTLRKMRAKKEYLELLDGYFDMYGYKVDSLKIPESNHRENYWYTKTAYANIYGVIPQKHLQEIKDCFNKGITFWKNPENIGNYSVSNLCTE